MAAGGLRPVCRGQRGLLSLSGQLVHLCAAWPESADQKDLRLTTFSTKPSDVQRAWHVVDAEGMVLGRVATEVARILRGKHKPIFAPHLDTGDHVVIVNAAKVVLTAGKVDKKVSYRHTGYPGGLRTTNYSDLMVKKPEEAVRRAVKGMLPKGTLGRQMLTKLKVYTGPAHPHAAQNPQPLDFPAARRAS